MAQINNPFDLTGGSPSEERTQANPLFLQLIEDLYTYENIGHVSEPVASEDMQASLKAKRMFIHNFDVEAFNKHVFSGKNTLDVSDPIYNLLRLGISYFQFFHVNESQVSRMITTVDQMLKHDSSIDKKHLCACIQKYGTAMNFSFNDVRMVQAFVNCYCLES